MLSKIWEFVNLKPFKLLVTTMVALLGVYGTFLWERKAEITFEVLSNVSVLDVRESLSNLVITYGGTNLKEQNQSLYLVTVRVVNSGNADVLKSSYDPGDLLGIHLSAGAIVEPPSIAGESYFVNSVKPQVQNARTILFAPIILNANDSFQIKALVLAKVGEIPQVTATGKIAGIQKIKVTQPYLESTGTSYWKTVFVGNIWVQLGRLLYLVVGIVIIALAVLVIGFPIAFITDAIGRLGRRKKAASFRTTLNRPTTLKEEYFLSQYIEGSVVYHRFRRLLEGNIEPAAMPGLEHMAIGRAYRDADTALANAGLVLRDGPQIIIDPETEATARSFVIYVASRPNSSEV
jgi:hypothetical protein